MQRDFSIKSIERAKGGVNTGFYKLIKEKMNTNDIYEESIDMFWEKINDMYDEENIKIERGIFLKDIKRKLINNYN